MLRKLTLLVTAGVLVALGNVCAQEGSAQEMSSAVPSASLRSQADREVAASTVDWNDTALQVTVGFEARRQSLDHVLSDLQGQSGVKLSAAAEMKAPQFLLTARIRKKPLCDVMVAVARLTSGRWSSNGDKSYVLAMPLMGIELALMNHGDSLVLQQCFEYRADDPRFAWLGAVKPLLVGKKQVPITDFPPDVQAKLKELVTLTASLRLIEIQQQAIARNILQDKLIITSSMMRVNGVEQEVKPIHIEVTSARDIKLGLGFKVEPWMGAAANAIE